MWDNIIRDGGGEREALRVTSKAALTTTHPSDDRQLGELAMKANQPQLHNYTADSQRSKRSPN